MNKNEFLTKVQEVLTSETTVDPENWTPENPFWGHCTVVTLLAQDLFGGEILRGSLEGTDFSTMRSHYWNHLPTGEEDFTVQQFQGNKPALEGKERTREYLLSNPDTSLRYSKLKQAFEMLR